MATTGVFVSPPPVAVWSAHASPLLLQAAVNKYLCLIVRQGSLLPCGGAPVIIGESGVPFDIGELMAAVPFGMVVGSDGSGIGWEWDRIVVGLDGSGNG